MLNAYRDHLSTRALSPKTIRRYCGTVALFTRFLHPLPLEAAATVDVEDFLRRSPNAKTRHAYRSDLGLFYRWAVRRAGYPANPVDDVGRIKVPRALPRPIGEHEAHVAVTFGELRTRRCVALGMYAGLRNAEIAALDGGDVDLTHRQLVVRHGKGGRDRVVPLHDRLHVLLADVTARGPVIVGRHGGPVTSETVGDIVRRHFQTLGIAATPHQLRHRFGTTAANVADLVVVAELMGHVNLATTRGYAAFDERRLRTAIDAMYRDAA